jgi:methionyl-tRNA formyltransferase
MQIRIVFMGSPDFAIPSLEALVQNFGVVGVVTQPDRTAGRGRKWVPPPVKQFASEHDIPVVQPHSLRRDPSAKRQLIAWKPGLIVVAAFGQILQKDVLELPAHGCLNVHASLLPRWRGVSPIQAAILNGDETTGVTIMKMDEGVDTGDIIAQRSLEIDSTDTGGSLFNKLSILGGELLEESLPDYISGRIKPQPQGPSPTPYAPMLKKDDGEIDFNQTADYISRQVRAYQPWPGTYTTYQGKLLKILHGYAGGEHTARVGQRVVIDGKPAFGTKQGLFIVEEIQPAGKKPMTGEVFLLGARDWVEVNN